jgi:glycosyltransferase involved in cell wall biosynthesis
VKNLKQLIEKSRQTPALAPIYAMEMDRQLRGMAKAPLTFSAKGLADEANETARALGLDKLFDAQPKKHAGGTIYQAEMLAKEGKRSEAIAHAFANAQGPEVNALNLLYANHATTNPKLRLHFLNKYISYYGLEIALQVIDGIDFFHQIKSMQTSERVDGPLVTVIMPAYNAEGTIDLAVSSLLNQSWQNLQIIVVDDASTDGTMLKAKDLAKRDPRIEVLRNPVNVGPYVCRNLGVLHTRGQWLTVHDADDWAFPDRIEKQVAVLIDANTVACSGRMLRMNVKGQITRPSDNAFNHEDGYLRLCFASLMVQTGYFRNELGAWDSVRVGGDAEMFDRLEVMGTSQTHLSRPLMLCLDNESGLTNNQTFGLHDETGKTQPLPANYKQAFTAWHKAAETKKISIFLNTRPFEAPKANIVDQAVIKKIYDGWSKKLELIKSSELFDSAWYKSQYPEVEQSGLEAEEHYLLHGSTGVTDPSASFNSRFYLVSRLLKTNPLIHHLIGKDAGPQPKRVLMAAAEVAKTGDHEQGIALAEKHLPTEIGYTSNILKANAALAKADEAAWQEHLNAYLAHFNLAPICLDASDGTIFNRLNASPLQPVNIGPLITVIMPAWNAETTVYKSAQSILNQTWRNLELIIVDDASTDGTWSVIKEIANLDYRVKIFRNKVNVGPYVSKNIALTRSKGIWITGHDADDWAHPQRLEKQCMFVLNNPGTKGILSGGFRMHPVTGHVLDIGGITDRRIDGVVTPVSITGFFERDFLSKKIGYWDSSRFGADSELIQRSRIILGKQFKSYIIPCELYMDTPGSLTNNTTFYFNKISGVSPTRVAYRNSWMKWHASRNFLNNYYIDFPQYDRHFEITDSASVPVYHVEECLK